MNFIKTRGCFFFFKIKINLKCYYFFIVTKMDWCIEHLYKKTRIRNGLWLDNKT